MTWKATNLLIKIVAGTFGAHLAARLAYRYRFGALGQTIVGAIGGIISGYLVEAAGFIVTNGSGPYYTVRQLDQMVEHGLMSAINCEVNRHRTAKRIGRNP
jgi:uncharacterized membrane protein YeaQ/YmgE (transglycosylase-associated protein family)